MFDPTIPYNDMPFLPLLHQGAQNSIPLLTQASKELGKLSGLCNILPDKDILIAPLLTKEAVSSSEIEDIHTTTQSVLQAHALGNKKTAGPEKEVLHYRDALMYGIGKLETEGGISTNTIVEIQRILEPDKKGIRKIPGTVIGNSNGEILHTPPMGQELIQKLLGNIERYFHTNTTIDPLIKIVECHYQFETIHPFLDGNGRTGRILMILQLLQSGHLEYPVLYLSEYIMKHKHKYYSLFQQTRRDGDISMFLDYILEGIIQQSLMTQEKVLGIQSLMDSSIKKINTLGLNGYDITKALLTSPYLSIGELAQKTQVSRQTASKHGQLLMKNGITDTLQIKNSKFISLEGFIELLS